MRAYAKQKGRFFMKLNGDIYWLHIEYDPVFFLMIGEKKA